MPLWAFFFLSCLTWSVSSSLRPYWTISRTAIFLAGHHPACFSDLWLSVAATNEQRCVGIPAHKNNPPNSKTELEGSLYGHENTTRQDTVFFWRAYCLPKKMISYKREILGKYSGENREEYRDISTEKNSRGKRYDC